MTVTSTQAGDTLILRVAGRLDAVTSPDFEKTCQQFLNSETRRMVMDFEDVDYISSAGLRAILAAGKKVRAAGGVFALSGLRGTVMTALETAGFCQLFPVYDSIEAVFEPR